MCVHVCVEVEVHVHLHKCVCACVYACVCMLVCIHSCMHGMCVHIWELGFVAAFEFPLPAFVVVEGKDYIRIHLCSPSTIHL